MSTVLRAVIGTSLLVVTVLAGSASMQAPDPEAGTPDAGIPIASETVRTACGACHQPDDKGRLSRISFQRNTPEGWQSTIQRMAALNGLSIEPQTAREVVKYLSNNLGLAPEEARPAAFEVERRLVDYTYKASPDTEAVCIKCHTMGRVISQRRTKQEWNLVIAMHRGWYPLTDFQAFRRGGPLNDPPAGDGAPRDTRQPVEKAIDHLASAFPLHTPEWAAWSATMRPAKLEGTWALRGWEPGKGAVYGRVVITPVAGATDEFTTTITYRQARTGEMVGRTGRATIYTGYQWRGRSTKGGDAATALREVMFVDRDWRTIQGRWFTGGYDEVGLDVTLERVGADTRILGTDRTALRAGSTGESLRIYGVNLPASLKPSDIELGPGVTVRQVAEATADVATVTVDVTATAAIGARDASLAGASRPRALAVFSRIDTLKVKPDWGMARVGGGTFPKMLAQFEAWGYQNGPDGRPDTADDIDLGLVDAKWSLEEYAATYGDDDVKYVGTLDATTGLFTPNVDGPNPAREGARNNIGDVWVVATVAREGSAGKAPLRARAHLLVTVPLYMRFDPSVSQ